MYKLSKRIEAGVEASPWLIEEIKKLEQEINDVYLEMYKLSLNFLSAKEIRIEAKRRYDEWCKQ